jgi:non-lysosomal glucosylceramidase
LSENKKVDRRQFIAGSSSAVIAASSISNTLSEAPEQSRSFRSPAGSTIPFNQRDLLMQHKVRSFTEQHLSEIAFPLGGIGTGTVSLGGRGDLRDWEIFNRPNKGKSLPFTFVALWVGQERGQAMTRVVESAPTAPFRGAHGFNRAQAQGLPHLRGARFTGAYPIAEIFFEDDTLPVTISLEAFTPFIPLETDDSSLPVAVFRYKLVNRTTQPVKAALAFSILNPIGYDGSAAINSNRFHGFGKNVTRLRREPSFAGLEMTSEKYQADDIRFGSLALVTTHGDVSARTAWEGGAWWDSFQKWFDEYAASGKVADTRASKPSDEGTSNYATLAPSLTIKPGGSTGIEFFLAWHFPVRENYWNSEPEVKGQKLRNYYATRFKDAWDVASYAISNLDRLERGTRAFQHSLVSSTLPSAVLDAVSSQVSIIRSNTCLLLEGKQFFAFEGTNDDSGCCPMNCTHVWNYEQALAHLFPDLDRSMRVTDFETNMRADNSMAFRTLIPAGKAVWDFKPAADGQMGCVMKLYREWQLSGDDKFLRRLWPAAKRALEYAWEKWDADQDGVMEGEQHNTYDIEFYGANTMMGTLYLGALLAGQRMAKAIGDNEAAEQYRKVFESGRVKLDRELWGDGFYVQRVPDPSRADSKSIDEGKIKYQYGDGCLSDQLLGQWFADVIGLGHLLPADHVRDALLSIYRYNFKHNFYEHPNTQRIYALNDEKGLLLCSWPRGRRPSLPFVYSDEVWTGIEYQVAAHLIYEGLVMEGLAIVKGVRDRYDGFRRNPWNEVECGSHYARALASWSLLTALSGYRYSAPEARLSFEPRINQSDFHCLFTTGGGWGTFSQKINRRHGIALLEVVHGSVTLKEFWFAGARPGEPIYATSNERVLNASFGKDNFIAFDHPITQRPGDKLQIRVGKP